MIMMNCKVYIMKQVRCLCVRVMVGLVMGAGILTTQAAPDYLNVQGYLLNAEGNPEHGTFEMTLNLQDLEERTLCSSEAVVVIPNIENGYFSEEVPVDDEFIRRVQPGVTKIQIHIESSESDSGEKKLIDLYQEVTSVPFALNAGQAVRANDLVVTHSLTATSGATTVMGAVKINHSVISRDSVSLDTLKVGDIKLQELSGTESRPCLMSATSLTTKAQFDYECLVQGDVAVMSFKRISWSISTISVSSDSMLLFHHQIDTFWQDHYVEVKHRDTATSYKVYPNLPNAGFLIPLPADSFATLKDDYSDIDFQIYSNIYLIAFEGSGAVKANEL